MPESKTKNPEFLQITHHGKLYPRILSKEISSSPSSTPSFRVYYGGASGAVPFLWESQPGKPKNTVQDNALPPLTPPPSYQSNNNKRKQAKKTSPRINSLLHGMLPRLSPPKRASLFSLPPSVSSSRSSGSRSSSSSDEGSPDSVLCYSILRGGGLRGGCNSMVFVKNALSSIVCGRASSRGTPAA